MFLFGALLENFRLLSQAESSTVAAGGSLWPKSR